MKTWQEKSKGIHLTIADPLCVIFVVTVDVESDDAWRCPERLSLNNLGIMPRFQNTCEYYGIIPTYFLSYETFSSEKFVSFLRQAVNEGSCDVGIHPHVWTIPPFIKEKNGVDVPLIRNYQSQLEEGILYDKLACLHEAVQQKIGIRPTSHRAGRWGLCLRTVRWLEDHCYTADSSVVPLKSFKDSSINNYAYPEYFNAPNKPYQMSEKHILIPGKLGLVEVPVTNIARWSNPHIVRLADFLKQKRGGTRLRNLLIKHSLYPMEFRPYPEYPEGTLSRMASVAISKHLPVLNLMFHSSELMEGTSPYSSDAGKTNKIWQHIKEIFSFIRDNKIPSMGISQAVKRLKENNYFV